MPGFVACGVLVTLALACAHAAGAAANDPPNDPPVPLLLRSWAAALTAQPPDGLAGEALAWNWLSSACTTVPCTSATAHQAGIQFAGSTSTAQIWRNITLAACANGEPNCFDLEVALGGTFDAGGARLVEFSLWTTHSGSWTVLTDAPSPLQGRLWGLAALADGHTVLDLDLLDGQPHVIMMVSATISAPGNLTAQVLRVLADPVRINDFDASSTTLVALRPLFARPLALDPEITCYGQPIQPGGQLCLMQVQCASAAQCSALTLAMQYEVGQAALTCTAPQVLAGGFAAWAQAAVLVTTDRIDVVATASQTRATLRCFGDTGDLRLSIKMVTDTPANNSAIQGHLDLLQRKEDAVWALAKHLPTLYTGYLQGVVATSEGITYQALPFDLWSFGYGGQLVPVSAPDRASVARFFAAAQANLMRTGNSYVDALVEANFGAAAVQKAMDAYEAVHFHPTDIGLLVWVADRLGLRLRVGNDTRAAEMQFSWQQTNLAATLGATVSTSQIAHALESARTGYADQYSWPDDWEIYWYDPTISTDEPANNNLIMAALGFTDDWRNPTWVLDVPLKWSLHTTAQVTYDMRGELRPLYDSTGLTAINGNTLTPTVNIRHVPASCDESTRFWCWWPEFLFCFYWDGWYWGWYLSWEDEYRYGDYQHELAMCEEHSFEHFSVAESADIFDVNVDQANVSGALMALVQDMKDSASFPNMAAVARRFDNTLTHWRSSTSAQVVGRSSYQPGRGFTMAIASASLECLTVTGDRTDTREVLGLRRMCVPIVLASNTTIELSAGSYQFTSSLQGEVRVRRAALPFAKDLMVGVTTYFDLNASLQVHSASSNTAVSVVDSQLTIDFGGIIDGNTPVYASIFNRASSADASDDCRKNPSQTLTNHCYNDHGHVTINWTLPAEPLGIPGRYLYDLYGQSLLGIVVSALEKIEAPAPGLQGSLANAANFQFVFGNVSLWTSQPKVQRQLVVSTSSQICPNAPHTPALDITFLINSEVVYACSIEVDYSSLQATEASLNAGLAACGMAWLVSVHLDKLHYDPHYGEQCGFFALHTTGFGGAYNVSVETTISGGVVWNGWVAPPRMQTFVGLSDASYLAQMLYNPRAARFHQPQLEERALAEFPALDLAPAGFESLLDPTLTVWTSRIEACAQQATAIEGNGTIYANGSQVRPTTPNMVQVQMQQCVNLSYGVVFRVPRLAGAEVNDSHAWHQIHTIFNSSDQLNRTLDDPLIFQLVLGAEDRSCPNADADGICLVPPSVVQHQESVVLRYGPGPELRLAFLRDTTAQLPNVFQAMITALELPPNPLIVNSSAQLAFSMDGIQLNATAWRIPTTLGVAPLRRNETVPFFNQRTYTPYPSRLVFAQCDISVRGTLAVTMDAVADIGIVPCNAAGIFGTTSFTYNVSMTVPIMSTQRAFKGLRVHNAFPNGFAVGASARGSLVFPNVTLDVIERYRHDQPQMTYFVDHAGVAITAPELLQLNAAIGAYNVTFSGPHATLFRRLNREQASEMCLELQKFLQLEQSLDSHPELLHELALIDVSLRDTYDLIFNDKFATLDKACNAGSMADLRQFCAQHKVVFGKQVCQSLVLDPIEQRITVSLDWEADNASLSTTMLFDMAEIFEERNLTLPVGEGEPNHVALVYSARFQSLLTFDFSQAQDKVLMTNTSVTLAVHYLMHGDQLLHFGMLPVRFAKTQAELQAQVSLVADNGRYVILDLNSTSMMLSEPALDQAPWCFLSVHTNVEFLRDVPDGVRFEQIECEDGGLPRAISDMLKKDSVLHYPDRPGRFVPLMTRISDIGTRVLYASGQPLAAGVQHPLLKNDYDAYILNFFSKMGSAERQTWLLNKLEAMSQAFSNLSLSWKDDVVQLRQGVINEFTELICGFTDSFRLSSCPKPPLANPNPQNQSLCAGTCYWDLAIGVSDQVQHTHVHSPLGALRFLHLQAEDTFTSDIQITVPIRFGLDSNFGPHFYFSGTPAITVWASLDLSAQLTGHVAFIGAQLDADAGADMMLGVSFDNASMPMFCANGATPPNCINPRSLKAGRRAHHHLSDDNEDDLAVEIVEGILGFAEGLMAGCSGIEFSDGCKEVLVIEAKAKASQEDLQGIVTSLRGAQQALRNITMPELTWHLSNDWKQIEQQIMTPLGHGVKQLANVLGFGIKLWDDIESASGCTLTLPEAPEDPETKKKLEGATKHSILKALRHYSIKDEDNRDALMDLIKDLLDPNRNVKSILLDLGKFLLPAILSSLMWLAAELMPLDWGFDLVLILYAIGRNDSLMSLFRDIIDLFKEFSWDTLGHATTELARVLNPTLDHKCDDLTSDLQEVGKQMPVLRHRRSRERRGVTTPLGQNVWPQQYTMHIDAYLDADGLLGIEVDGSLTELPYMNASLGIVFGLTLGQPVRAPTVHMNAALHLGSFFGTIVHVLHDHLLKFLGPAQHVVEILQTKIDLFTFIFQRPMPLAEVVPYLDELFGGNVEQAQEIANFLAKFLRLLQDLETINAFLTQLEDHPAHFLLGNFSVDFERNNVTHHANSTRTLHFLPGQEPPPDVRQLMDTTMKSFLGRSNQHFALLFPIFEHLDELVPGLLFGQTNFNMVEVDLPDVGHSMHIPIGPFMILPWPTITIGGLFDFGIALQNVRIVFPLSGIMAFVRSHDPADFLSQLSLMVKDSQGNQIYQLKLFAGFAVEVAVGFLIFMGGLGLGFAAEVDMGFRDPQGNGLLSVADAVYLIEKYGFGAIIEGRIEFLLFLTAFIEACVPIPFDELCWTIVQWAFQWVLFQWPFGQGALEPVATADGVINPQAAMGIEPLVVQLTSVQAGSMVKLGSSMSPQEPASTASRSIVVPTSSLRFGDVGNGCNVFMTTFLGSLALPTSTQVSLTLEASGYPHVREIVVNAAGISAKDAFTVSVADVCQNIQVIDTFVNLAFTVSHVACPLSLQTSLANNVTIMGAPGPDFDAQRAVTLQSANVLAVLLEDVALTLDSSTIASGSQGTVVTFQGPTIQQLVLRGALQQSTTFIIQATRPETVTQVIGQLGDDNFVIPDLNRLGPPVSLYGGPGDNGLSTSATLDGQTHVTVSEGTLQHASAAGRQYVFTRNVYTRMFNYALTATANVSTELKSIVWGENVLLNIVGMVGARAQHTIKASSLGAQLKYVLSKPGEHEFHIGADDTLLTHMGVVELSGSADPDQYVSVTVHARLDPRTLVIHVKRNLLSVVDSADPAEDVFRLSFHHVDELILEISGLTFVDNERDSTAYDTEVSVIMFPHVTVVDPDFEPTRRIWSNNVTVLGSNSHLALLGDIRQVDVGPQPGMSPFEPDSDCTSAGAACTEHPLAAVLAPLYIVGSGRQQPPVLRMYAGSSVFAPGQGVVVQGTDIFWSTLNGTRQGVPTGKPPSARFCARLADHGASSAAMCDSQAHIRFQGKLAVALRTGGGPDHIVFQDTAATPLVDTGAGWDTVLLANVSTDFSVALGPGDDYLGLQMPCQGNVSLGTGMDTMHLGDPTGHADPMGRVQRSDGAWVYYDVVTGLTVAVVDETGADNVDVRYPPHACQGCAQLVTSPALPPGATVPEPSFSTVVNMADITVQPTSQTPSGIFEYVIDSCKNMPFRILAARTAGHHNVTVINCLAMTCALSVTGTSYNNQTLQLTLGFGTSSNLALMADEDAVHLRSIEHRSFLRLALAHVGALSIVGSPTGKVSMEVNEMEPSINVAVLLSPPAVSASSGLDPLLHRSLRVLGSASPMFLSEAGFHSIMVGPDPHPANPLNPMAKLYSVLILTGSQPANVTVAGGSEDYAASMALGLDGQCLGQLGADGQIQPASDLLLYFNISDWLCLLMIKRGVPPELCTTTCPLSLLQPIDTLSIETGGSGDQVTIRHCQGVSTLLLRTNSGDDRLTVEDCLAEVYAWQALGNDVCELRAPMHLAIVDQGNAEDLPLGHSNVLTAAFGEPASLQPGAVRTRTSQVTLVQALNPGDILQVLFDPTLPPHGSAGTPDCVNITMGGSGDPRIQCADNTVFCIDTIVDTGTGDPAAVTMDCASALNVTIRLNITKVDMAKRATLSVTGSPGTVLSIWSPDPMSVMSDLNQGPYEHWTITTSFKLYLGRMSRVQLEAPVLSFDGLSVTENLALLGFNATYVGELSNHGPNMLVRHCADCTLPASYWRSAATQQFVLVGANGNLSTVNDDPTTPLHLGPNCLRGAFNRSKSSSWLADVAGGLGVAVCDGCPVTVNGTHMVNLTSTTVVGQRASLATRAVHLTGLHNATFFEPDGSGVWQLRYNQAVLPGQLEVMMTSLPSVESDAIVVLNLQGPLDRVELAADDGAAAAVTMNLTDSRPAPSAVNVSWTIPGNWTGLVSSTVNLTLLATLNVPQATVMIQEENNTKAAGDHALAAAAARVRFSVAALTHHLRIEVVGAQTVNATLSQGGQHQLSVPSANQTQLGTSSIVLVTDAGHIAVATAGVVNVTWSDQRPKAELVFVADQLACADAGYAGGRIVLHNCYACSTSLAPWDSLVAVIGTSALGSVVLNDAQPLTVDGACAALGARPRVQPSTWLATHLARFNLSTSTATLNCSLVGVALANLKTAATLLAGAQMSMMSAHWTAMQAMQVTLTAQSLSQQGLTWFAVDDSSMRASVVRRGAAGSAMVELPAQARVDATLKQSFSVACLSEPPAFVGNLSITSLSHVSGSNAEIMNWRVTGGCHGRWVGPALSENTLMAHFEFHGYALVLQHNTLSTAAVVVQHVPATSVSLEDGRVDMSIEPALQPILRLDLSVAAATAVWQAHELPSSVLASLHFLQPFKFTLAGSMVVPYPLRFYARDQTIANAEAQGSSTCVRPQDCSSVSWAAVRVDGRPHCLPKAVEQQCTHAAQVNVSWVGNGPVECLSLAGDRQLQLQANVTGSSAVVVASEHNTAVTLLCVSLVLVVAVMVANPQHVPLALFVLCFLVALAAARPPGLDQVGLFSQEMRHGLRDWMQKQNVCFDEKHQHSAVFTAATVLSVLGAVLVIGFAAQIVRQRRQTYLTTNEGRSLLPNAVEPPASEPLPKLHRATGFIVVLVLASATPMVSGGIEGAVFNAVLLLILFVAWAFAFRPQMIIELRTARWAAVPQVLFCVSLLFVTVMFAVTVVLAVDDDAADNNGSLVLRGGLVFVLVLAALAPMALDHWQHTTDRGPRLKLLATYAIAWLLLSTVVTFSPKFWPVILIASITLMVVAGIATVTRNLAEPQIGHGQQPPRVPAATDDDDSY